eukprot:m.300475 g.300475  ORF g.300475 m.300475 type:complete len:337 (-) comp14469_c0_seq1:91-1101(-)
MATDVDGSSIVAWNCEGTDDSAPATPVGSRPGSIEVPNPHLAHLVLDNLYHFGLDSSQPLEACFGDIRVVCVGGSTGRMEAFARRALRELDIPLPVGSDLINLSSTDRYCLFKAGPMLSVSHGMGVPSMSIMLHEIAKLLHYAKARRVSIIRIGTSGGVGVEPGTVIVTSKVYNGQLEPVHRLAVLGELVERPTTLSRTLSSQLMAAAPSDIQVLSGATMTCDDFYEGQARLDGAFCSYSNEDKMNFLKRCKAQGIRNIEMEALGFASFCNHLNVPAAVVCVTLLDRLEGDQLTKDKAALTRYSDNPQRVVYAYIRRFVMGDDACEPGTPAKTSAL